MNVLVIDEDIQVHILVRVLRNRHPEDKFELAPTLASATNQLWGEKYDVLVVDIMMPGNEAVVEGSSDGGGVISGLQLLEKVSADQNCPNNKTPYVILTGVPVRIHPKIVEASQQCGERFILKPVKPDVLYGKLGRIISRGS